MSILIKGMEMPTSCADCKWRMAVGCCGNLPHNIRMPNCPLIKIPPHGRLIEDTVLDNMTMWNTNREYDRGWDSAVQAAKNRIKSAPTIIESEE